MGDWFIYGLPIGALILGSLAYIVARRESRDFDRRYGREDQAVSDLFDRSSRRVK